MDIEEFMDEHFGRCSGCIHLTRGSYDPSPAGVALPPGSIDYEECGLERFYDDPNTDEDCGYDEENMCPYWSSNLGYCDEHGYYRGHPHCTGCVMEAEMQHIEEMKRYEREVKRSPPQGS